MHIFPRLYVNGLMNSFRTETFNVTSTGQYQSFFLQGGQRWQSIELLTGSSIAIAEVGFRPSVSIKPPDRLIGAFSASEPSLAQVWDLGARAVQAACVEAHSQPSTWEITDQGALIRGQFPAYSAKGVTFGNYTMSFSTKIVTGGTGWRVAAGANDGYGPYFVLTTRGPHFVNHNGTLLPPNSLTAGFGFSIINQTILPSAPISHFPVSFDVVEDEWYRITTTISSNGYNISVNDTHLVYIDSAQFQEYVNPSWGSPSTTDGTWGFGPFLDQAAYFTAVEVTSSSGKTLYTNPLTSEDVLPEYRMAENREKVCLDGAKRDRLIWIGDFAHTARILAASSGRYDFIQSMIEFEFDWQLTHGAGNGLVPIQEAMGDGWKYRYAYYPSQYGENDYYILFLLTVGDYWGLTEDLDLMQQYWVNTKALVETLVDRFLNPASGLLADPNDGLWFTAQGAQNATAPTALFVIALQGLLPIATALGDSSATDEFKSLANGMTAAINTKLWSDDLGTYVFALDNQKNHSVLSAAFPIRAGIANDTQAKLAIQSLSDLFLQIGYKDSTVIPNGPQTQLSPNVQGFLLESLFLAHIEYNVSADIVTPVLRNMLDIYWPHMVDQNQYYTGASWEYVYADGAPGIGIFTSLCHPWGGAPTYVLSNYVLGIRRELDKGSNEFEWVVDPVWEVVEKMGLTKAHGRMPLPNGGFIETSWWVTNGARKCQASVHGGANVRIHTKAPCHVLG